MEQSENLDRDLDKLLASSINQKIGRLFGLKPDELLGKPDKVNDMVGYLALTAELHQVCAIALNADLLLENANLKRENAYLTAEIADLKAGSELADLKTEIANLKIENADLRAGSEVADLKVELARTKLELALEIEGRGFVAFFSRHVQQRFRTVFHLCLRL